jgi:hypothetical protein
MKSNIIIFLLLLSGCSYFSDQPKFNIGQVRLTGKICFNHETDSILRTFINKCYCDSCIYELYIDKKDPFEYKLTIQSILSTENYLRDNHPVNYTSIDGNIVFIYSGIEDFINAETYLSVISTKQSSKIEYISSWSYVILKDTSYFIENINPEIPFINMRQMPNIIYKSPE